jgi:hypothetical protein
MARKTSKNSQKNIKKNIKISAYATKKPPYSMQKASLGPKIRPKTRQNRPTMRKSRLGPRLAVRGRGLKRRRKMPREILDCRMPLLFRHFSGFFFFFVNFRGAFEAFLTNFEVRFYFYFYFYFIYI